MDVVNDNVSRGTDQTADQLGRVAKMGVDKMQQACELWHAMTDEMIVPLVMVLKVENNGITRMQMVGPQLGAMPPELLIGLFEKVIDGLKNQDSQTEIDMTDVLDRLGPEDFQP